MKQHEAEVSNSELPELKWPAEGDPADQQMSISFWKSLDTMPSGHHCRKFKETLNKYSLDIQ